MTARNEPSDSKIRIVTLTNAPPARIRDDDWPMIARTTWHEGSLEYQPHAKGWIVVRRHADGRALIYGALDVRTADEDNLRAGEVVLASTEIVEAIHRVARDVRAPERAIRDAIARLPPVEI